MHFEQCEYYFFFIAAVKTNLYYITDLCDSSASFFGLASGNTVLLSAHVNVGSIQPAKPLKENRRTDKRKY